jgi:hypothetical protein
MGIAKTQLPAATGMSDLALRDHAKQMLEAIALDIETKQSSKQQYDKSKGLDLAVTDSITAAATHGTLRENSGCSLPQLLAEFRALRATVLRLWSPQIQHFRPVAAGRSDFLEVSSWCDTGRWDRKDKRKTPARSRQWPPAPVCGQAPWLRVQAAAV